MKLKRWFAIFLSLYLLMGFGIIKALDYKDTSPTVIVSEQKFKNNTNHKIVAGDKISEEFTAKNNQLGIIAIKFNTDNPVENEYLLFKIKETSSDQWHYVSKYRVDQFKLSQYFPFGFPQISDSKNKQYLFELEFLGEDKTKSLEVLMKNSPFLIKYSYPYQYLLQNKNEIASFLLKKVASFFCHIELGKYLFIIVSILLINFLSIPSNNQKVIHFFKKITKINIKNKQNFWVKFKNYRLINPILKIGSICTLFIFNLSINGPIRLKAFAFSDDLIAWHFFDANRNNFLNFILDTGANKFRPVFLSIYFLILSLIKDKIWLFGVSNLLLNFVIAVILFLLFQKIAKNILVSLCLSIAFIVSRFAYYDITQSFGLMEAMALLISIIMLFLLWQYLNTKQIKYYWISLPIFTLLLLTHERFVVLIFLYAITLLLSKLTIKKIFLLIMSALPVILIWGIKIFVLKIRPLDGTGGTDIMQTFNLPTFFQFFFSGWLYLLGINAGPTYLNGISMDLVPENIRILIFIANFLLITLVAIYLKFIFTNKKNISKKIIINFIFFFSFIILTLTAASVTFRLEMRWLYVPFTGLLFLLAHMIGSVAKHKIFQKICPLIILLWLGVLIPIEIFYRSNYKNLYYWGMQLYGNSFYEETLEKYGNNFWNYQTYIICGEKTSLSMLSCKDHGDFNYFFQQFETNDKKTDIGLISDMSLIPTIQKEKNVLLLLYNQKTGKLEKY